MTDPEFCFRSNVQYPNRLLGFYDAPELLQTSSPKYDMVMIISLPCPITRALGNRTKTHVGGYPRCGITARVQTQRFPIGPGTSAELHIVDILDLAHLFTLDPHAGQVARRFRSLMLRKGG